MFTSLIVSMTIMSTIAGKKYKKIHKNFLFRWKEENKNVKKMCFKSCCRFFRFLFFGTEFQCCFLCILISHIERIYMGFMCLWVDVFSTCRWHPLLKQSIVLLCWHLHIFTWVRFFIYSWVLTEPRLQGRFRPKESRRVHINSFINI